VASLTTPNPNYSLKIESGALMRKSYVIRVTFSQKPGGLRARRRQMISATLRRLAGLPLAVTLVVCAILSLAALANAASDKKDTHADDIAFYQAADLTNPAAEVEALESFLQNYPQSHHNKWSLSELIRIYQEMGEDNKALGASERLLQMDPNNLYAIYCSVLIRKSRCEKTGDPQSCNDAATLARRGVALPRPDDVSDDEWEKATALFQSAIPEQRARLAAEQTRIAAEQAEQQKKDAAVRADQQARYDKVMNGGRPAQLYSLAGDLEAEGRPEMAADLYQALIDNFPDDPYTVKAIERKEAARAAAQQQAQPAAGQPVETDSAHLQATADCQQQCNAALNACKSDANGQVKAGVAMGVLGKLLKTTSVADSITSVGSTAVDGFGACNDAYTSCTAACR
jgi:tetratricopeptide (TPR) repeat protein